MVPDDRLLPAPDDLDRAADAALAQAQSSQCQHDLHGHILAPAECAADRRIDHPHPVERQRQGVCDLLLVLVRPLPGNLDGDPALFVDVSQPCLRLEVGVLLVRGVVLALDNDLRLGKGVLHISLADR